MGTRKHMEAARPARPRRLRRPDADSGERLAEEILEKPHEATRFSAPNGMGTSHGAPHDIKFLERPILDGASQSRISEASVPNPYRGKADPATVAEQPALTSARTSRWLIAACIAATVVTVLLLLLARWNPVWCGVGIVFALVGLLLMLVVRASGLERRRRLRLEATLMGAIWIVPLAIFVAVLGTSADRIW